MCGSIVDIQSVTAEIRRGKKQEEEDRRRRKPQGKNIMSASATQGGHNEIVFLWTEVRAYGRMDGHW